MQYVTSAEYAMRRSASCMSSSTMPTVSPQDSISGRIACASRFATAPVTRMMCAGIPARATVVAASAGGEWPGVDVGKLDAAAAPNQQCCGGQFVLAGLAAERGFCLAGQKAERARNQVVAQAVPPQVVAQLPQLGTSGSPPARWLEPGDCRQRRGTDEQLLRQVCQAQEDFLDGRGPPLPALRIGVRRRIPAVRHSVA